MDSNSYMITENRPQLRGVFTFKTSYALVNHEENRILKKLPNVFLAYLQYSNTDTGFGP